MADSIKVELIKFVTDLKSKDPKITWQEVAERFQLKFARATGVPLTVT